MENNVFSLLVSLLDPSLKTWIPVLILLGIWLKQSVKLKGKFVPIGEIVSGLAIAAINCAGRGLGLIGTLGFVIGQGLLLAATSMALYDTGRAVIEICKGKSSKSTVEVQETETLEVNKEETK